MKLTTDVFFSVRYMRELIDVYLANGLPSSYLKPRHKLGPVHLSLTTLVLQTPRDRGPTQGLIVSRGGTDIAGPFRPASTGAIWIVLFCFKSTLTRKGK